MGALKKLSNTKSLGKPAKAFNFDQTMVFVLKWEGGLSNKKSDRGGLTKYGISQKAYPKLDIKNLTMEKALDIYKSDYWVPSGANEQPWPVCLAVMDSAVNCGAGTAKKWLLSGMAQNKTGMDLVMEIVFKRRQKYAQIVARMPSQQANLKGWNNRCDDLILFALKPFKA